MLVGGLAGPHRAARPGPGADPPQRRNLPRATAGTTTWPGVTGCWAAWPWPPGTPPPPGRTWPPPPRSSATATTSPNSPTPSPSLAACAQATGDLDTADTPRRPRRSPSPPPRGLVPAQCRRPGRPGPAPRRPGHCRRPNPTRWPRAGTPPTPRCAWPPATTWPGTNSTRCAPTPPSTRPKAPTRAGPPRPTRCTTGWSRPAWIPTRWPPSNGSSPSRKRPRKPATRDEGDD